MGARWLVIRPQARPLQDSPGPLLTKVKAPTLVSPLTATLAVPHLPGTPEARQLATLAGPLLATLVDPLPVTLAGPLLGTPEERPLAIPAATRLPDTQAATQATRRL